jgi:translation initiation factor 2 gamma subunit (eIF-2gamma)
VVSAQVEPDTIVLERDRMGKVVLKESVCASKGHRVIMSGEISHLKYMFNIIGNITS